MYGKEMDSFGILPKRADKPRKDNSLEVAEANVPNWIHRLISFDTMAN